MPETASRNAQRLKIIHCLRAPVGGVFRHVADLVQRQAAAGLQVGLVCDASTGGRHAAERLREMATCCALGVQRHPMPRSLHISDIVSARAVGRVCQRLKPDIIHGHGAKGGAYARLIAHTLGARAIYTPHGGALHYAPRSAAGAIYLRVERFLRRYTDGVIFESEFSARTYARNIGRLACPHRVIHNGLRATEFAPLTTSPDARDFVFAGELRKLKGVDVLLQALALVIPRRAASLLLAGAGDDADHVRSRIDALGLNGATTLLPPLFPATRAFAAGRCVVVPSLAESLPYVVLEAAAAGMPLLATRVGGIPEIYGPYAERLLPPNDAIALAAAMEQTLDDPGDAHEFAVALREQVRTHFALDAMVQATCELYRQVLQRA